jgi:O-6-methylguanine DNA methyltransferase
MKPPSVAVGFYADGNRLLHTSIEKAATFTYSIQGTGAALHKQLEQWLNSYLTGTPNPFPFSLPSGSTFQQDVWRALVSIPFGKTLSYSQLATQIGRPGAARAVGNACNKNPYPLLIPCHRVTAKEGIGGFAMDLSIKESLLRFEAGTEVPALN